MPERPNPSLQLPGYSAPHDIPGQAKKLATRAAEGRGEIGAEQAAANRLFRTRESDEYTSPLPRRVESIADVTAGLGLDRATETRVQRMVEEQRADFSKKGQTQRSFLAANGLTETLRRIRDVPSDARMEITKRARAFWRNTQPTDYAKEPTVRARQGTQMRSDSTIKSGVRYVIRDPLMKAPRGAKPLPPGMHATPPIPQGPAPTQPQPGAAPAAGGASTTHAPAGFQPIPHSTKGGFRKKEGDGWTYWYPGAGITSTPHPADAGQARAKRSAQASGPMPKKPGKGPPPAQGAAPPAGAPPSAGPPQAGVAPPKPGAPSAGPPPLPGKAPKPGAGAPQAGAAPATAGGQGAAPPTMAGAPKPGAAPPQAGGAPPGPPQQQGPHKASEQPQVTKDHTGEKRQFHPLVHAHTPAGKENDHQHHAGEFQRHRAEKKAAMRAGDAEKAKAHTYAMNFHADKHNRLLAAAQGRQYAPKGNFPGADPGDGSQGAAGGEDPSSVIASQYDRVGKQGKNGESGSAADPRERFVPESAAVKGMRERIGKAVSIMADLSQAHDHLSSLKAKRMEAKRSGHPLARRMISQIDAEIAATKHDIVQLEDAHGHAMKEVLAHQSQLRNERIKANPIFVAFMNAMQSLGGLSQKIGASLGEKAGEALEGAKGAIDDFKNRGAKAKQDAERAQFDQSLAAGAAADANPESGEVKPLGVSKEDIAARFGDPEAAAQGKQRDAEAMDTLKKLGAMQGDEPEPEEVGAEDVEALPDDEGTAVPSEGGGNEAEAAMKDIFGMQQQREQGAVAAKQRAEESAGFDRDLASARNKRDEMEQRASAQAEIHAQRMAGRSDRSVMRAALGADDGAEPVSGHAPTVASRVSDAPAKGTVASRPGKVPPTREDKGTIASGVRKKKSAEIAVEKSARLVKSHEWREVLRLAPKLDNTLRKSIPVHYVAPVAFTARAPMTFLDLYG